MANRIMLNETSYFGKGAIQEIAGEVKSRGCRKVMLCTDPDLLRFGVAARVIDVWRPPGLPARFMMASKPTRRLKMSGRGVAFCRRENADILVAVGGGSAIDTSKAIVRSLCRTQSLKTFAVWKVPPHQQQMPAPIIAVSTTSAHRGGGDHNNVITDTEKAP